VVSSSWHRDGGDATFAATVLEAAEFFPSNDAPLEWAVPEDPFSGTSSASSAGPC